MTASPDRLPPALVLDVAGAEARLPPRAGDAGGRVRALAAGRAARRAPGPLAQAPGRRRPAARPAAGRRHRPGPRRHRHGHLVPGHAQHPRAAALPRQGHDRARVARGAAAGRDRHHRPPGAARVPRPALGPAQPGLRARPHVHVALLHLRLDPAPGRGRRAPDVDPSRARSPRRSSRCPRCSPRAGGRASSAPPRSAGRPRHAWPSTSSRPPPPRRPARRCASRASARAWSRIDAWPGSGGTGRWRRPAGAAPAGTRWPGRSSAPPTSGAIVFVSSGLRATPGDVLLVLAAGGAALGLHRRDRRRDRLPARHLARRLAAPGLARGLRGVGGGLGRPARALASCAKASASRACRSPIPAPSASCSTPSTSLCPRARWWRSSGRTARARRRSSSCSASCTSRRRAGSWSMARPSIACGRTSGARASPAPSRTSSGSSSPPATRWASATCRAWTTSAAVDGRGRPRRSRRRGGPPARRPRHPARADLARRGRGVVRPVAEARARPRLHAREAAAAGARRAHGGPRRRDRARALRALRRGARGADAQRGGGITILVSHRFSTVRMADLIVVLDGARVAQVGSHDELMAKGGPYAELYGIQAAAYR